MKMTFIRKVSKMHVGVCFADERTRAYALFTCTLPSLLQIALMQAVACLRAYAPFEKRFFGFDW